MYTVSMTECYPRPIRVRVEPIHSSGRKWSFEGKLWPRSIWVTATSWSNPVMSSRGRGSEINVKTRLCYLISPPTAMWYLHVIRWWEHKEPSRISRTSSRSQPVWASSSRFKLKQIRSHRIESWQTRRNYKAKTLKIIKTCHSHSLVHAFEQDANTMDLHW